MDIKWSPLHRRYFTAAVQTLTPPGVSPTDPNFRQVVTVLWSEADPKRTEPPTFSDDRRVALPNPAGRNAIWGGILSEGLGHILDTAGADPHVSFESYATGTDFEHGTDLAHAAVTLLSVADRAGVVRGRAYRDANANGRRDAGELWTTTDTLGNYQFQVLPGRYRVRAVVSTGYADPGGRSVTVAAGGTATTLVAVARR